MGKKWFLYIIASLSKLRTYSNNTLESNQVWIDNIYWLTGSLTIAAVCYVEIGRLADANVPIPFLLLYASVILSAYLGGLRGGLVGGVVSSTFVIYASMVNFGPPTLTGGLLPVVFGVLLYMLSAVLLGRVVDQNRILRRASLSYQDRLEKILAERTAELQAFNHKLQQKNGEYQQREIALQESEIRFQQLFFMAPVPMAITLVSDGTIVMMNDLVAPTLVLPPEDILGSKAPDFYVNAADRQTIVEQLLAEGYVRDKEVSIKKGDNTLAWVLISMQQITFHGEPAILTSFHEITEQKQWQETLRASEERFRALVEKATDIISVVDIEGRFVYESPALYTLLGYTANELLGRSAFDFVHPEDLSAALEKFAELLATPSGMMLHEFRFLHHDGSWHFLEATGRNLLDNPAVGGIVANARDITSRRRLEVALQESERNLQTLMSNLPGMAYRCRIDDDWTEEFVSDGCSALTGYLPSDLILNRTIAYGDLIHPDDRNRVRGEVHKALAAKHPYQLRYRITTQSGEEKWVWEQGREVITLKGNSVLEGFITDTTELKQAEDRLRDSEERFAGILNIAAEAIIATDEAQEIILFNRGAEYIFGYAADEVVGKSLDILIPESLRSKHRNHIRAFAHAPEVARRMDERQEISGLRKDGEVFPAEASVSKLDIYGRKIFTVVLRDITERKQTQDRLRESEERHRRLHESTYDIIHTVDPDGHILVANKAWLNTLGYTEAELAELTLWKCIDAKSIPYCREKFAAIMAGSPVTDLKATFIRKDGGLIEVEGNASPAYRGDKVVASHGFFRDMTEQKRAERALAASEARYRIIAELISDYAYAYCVNPDGTWDREWLTEDSYIRVTGYTPGEHGTPFGLYHPEDARTAQEHVKQNAQGQPTQGEYRIITKSGDIRWLYIRQEPVWDKQEERVTHVYGVAQDITERKRAELALQEAHNQLLLLNRTVSLAGATLEIEKVLSVTCRELAHTFRVPQTAAALLDEDRRATRVIAEYLAEGRSSALGNELPIDNSPVWDYLLQHRKSLVITDAPNDPRLSSVHDIVIQRGIQSLLILPLTVQGNLVGSIGVDAIEPYYFSEDDVVLAEVVAQAISQVLENSFLHRKVADHNKELEETVSKRTIQLSRLNERMTAILNSTSSAIILAKPDGTIDITNPTFSQYFGYEPDELYEQPLITLVQPEHADKVLAAFQTAAKESEPQRLEIIAQRKDGTTFDADATLATVIRDDGSLEGVVCSLNDITYLKEVDRMKDRFISMVSHELRTPVTGLLLSANSLKNYYERLTEERRFDIINRMKEQANALAELIENVLDISRISEIGEESFITVEMQETVEKVISELQLSATVKEQKIQFLIAATITQVVGQPTEFSRIWRNLISNAIKYTPKEGTITVRLGAMEVISETPSINLSGISQNSLNLPPQLPQGKYLIGQVEDTGQGIPPEDVKQLFTRFYRGAAVHSGIPGTGLGLALVRDLLRRYSGDICVVSEVHVGSIFSFWLPIGESISPEVSAQGS